VVLANSGFKVSVVVTSIHLAQTAASRHTYVVFKSVYTNNRWLSQLKYPNLLEAGQNSCFRIKIVTLQAFVEHKQAADNDPKR